MGEGIGGQDIWGNSLTNEERWQHFNSGALGSGLSLLGGGAALGKLGVLSQPTLAGVATYGTFSDGQDIGAAMTGRDIEGNSLSLPDRLARGGMGLLGALDLASPGGKYPLTPESAPRLHETTPELNLPLLPGAKGNDSSIIPLIPPKLHEEVNVPSVIHPPNRSTDGLNLPLIPGQKNGDSSDIIPFIPPHGQSSVTPPSVIHPQNRSGETTTHPHHPEIEPGVVAKEKTHDGHEIKVLKDGRVVRCSDCGEIRNKYAEQLEQKPELKQRLEQIEKIANPQEKAKQAQQLEKELASERKKIIAQNGDRSTLETGNNVPSYSLEGKSLVDTVLDDTNEIIDRTKLPEGHPQRISNKELARQQATSRAQSLEPPHRTPHFENIHPYDHAKRKNITVQEFPGFTIVGMNGTESLLRVSDVDTFMDHIGTLYKANGSTLHPYIEKRIRDLVTNAQEPFNSTRGVPGLHAEVRAANDILHYLTSQGYDVDKVVSQIGIATGKLSRGAGGPFIACPNCSAILEEFLVLTESSAPHK